MLHIYSELAWVTSKLPWQRFCTWGSNSFSGVGNSLKIAGASSLRSFGPCRASAPRHGLASVSSLRDHVLFVSVKLVENGGGGKPAASATSKMQELFV